MADQQPAKPRHHGRDHLPGGEDPIPGLTIGGGSSYAPSPSVALYSADETVASLDGNIAVWTFVSGNSALLDLTNSQFPQTAARGVYSVTATVTSPDATWSPGENLVGKLDAFGTTVNQHMEGSGTFDLAADPAHTRAFVGLVAQMGGTAGQTFKLTLENEGAASHILFAQIAVQLILVY